MSKSNQTIAAKKANKQTKQNKQTLQKRNRVDQETLLSDCNKLGLDLDFFLFKII